MKKIVINSQFGGFSPGFDAILRYAEIKGIKVYPFLYDLHDDKHISKVDGFTDKEKDSLFGPHFATSPVKAGQFLDDVQWFSERDIPRDDPALVQLVEEMGEKAGGQCSTLSVVEIPDDVDWYIEEYDGNEWVAEKHRKWDEDGEMANE